jgi:polyhydroxybutyrate depolymerase
MVLGMEWGWKANLKRAAFAAFGVAIGVALAPPSPTQSQDRIPGDTIRERIQDRMERKRLERVPRLGSIIPAPGGVGPGQESIVIGGRVRTFSRYTPNKVLVSGKRAPVVFALHGEKGTGDKLQGYLGLNVVADREGFIVVYPQGANNQWNDGRAFDVDPVSVDAQTVDDAGFLNSLADALVVQGVGDPKRLFVAGISNGGSMALRLGCGDGSRFAGYGAIAASLPTASTAPCIAAGAIPVVMINGTDDKVVRLTAGDGKSGIAGNAAPMEAAAYFANRNGCTSASDIPLPDSDATDGTTVTLRTWSGCKPGAAVEFYTVKGGGHQAPVIGATANSIVLDELAGTRSHDIDSAETLWNFFKRLTAK